MATTYKVLGQSNPAATTATTLYTVPSATSAVCSTIVIAALGASTTFRIAVRPAATTAVASTLAFRILNTSQATLRGWAITG